MNKAINTSRCMSHVERKRKRMRTAAVEILMLFADNTENVRITQTPDGNVKVSPSDVCVEPQMFSMTQNIKIDEDTRKFMIELLNPVIELNKKIEDTHTSINDTVSNITKLPSQAKQILSTFFDSIFGKNTINARFIVLALLACYRLYKKNRLSTFERMLVLCSCVYLLYDLVENERDSIVEFYVLVTNIMTDVLSLILLGPPQLEARESGDNFSIEPLLDLPYVDSSQIRAQAQAGDLDFDISCVESLVDLALSGLGMTNYWKGDSKASLFGQLKDVSAMRPNFQKLVKSYIDIIIGFVNWIAYKTFGELNWIRKKTGIVEADNIISRVDLYVRQSYSGTLPYSRGLVGDMELLRKELSELIRHTPRSDSTFGAIAEMQKKASQLETIYQALCINPKHKAGYRFETILIYIDGEPGTGKTTVSNFIVSECVRLTTSEEEFRHYEQNNAHYVFNRNPENEYWDGYRSHHRVVKYDDLGQKRDQIGEDQWFEIIRTINVSPYHLHMASIEEKKNSFFDSPWVVATSNIPHEKERFISHVKSLNYPEALYRRLMVNIQPIPSSSISTNGKIDKTKFASVKVPTPYLWKYRVSGAGVTNRVFPWEDLKRYLSDVYETQLKMFERNVLGQAAYNKTLFDKDYKELYMSALPKDVSLENFLTRASTAVLDASDALATSMDNPLKELREIVIGKIARNQELEGKLEKATIMAGVCPQNGNGIYVYPQVGSEWVRDWNNAHPIIHVPADLNDVNGVGVGVHVLDDSSETTSVKSEQPIDIAMRTLDEKSSDQLEINYIDVSTMTTHEEKFQFEPVWTAVEEILSTEDIDIFTTNLRCSMSFHSFVMNDTPFDVACLYFHKEKFSAATFRHILMRRGVWNCCYGSSYTLPGIESKKEFVPLVDSLRVAMGLPSVETMKMLAATGLVLYGIWKGSNLVISVVRFLFPSLEAQSNTHLSRNKTQKPVVNVREHLAHMRQVRVAVPQGSEGKQKVTNSEENSSSIVKKSMVQIRLVSKDGIFHMGYALGVRDNFAIYPAHFMTKWIVDHQGIGDEIEFERGSLIFRISVDEFLKLKECIAWPDKDLILGELPAELGRFKDITSKFAKAADKPISAVPVRIPLPHANIRYGTLAKISNYDLNYQIGHVKFKTKDTLTYPCKTKRGDCGAPILRDDNQTQQRVILGIHLAMDGMQQAYSAALYQETLSEMFKGLDLENNGNVEAEPHVGIPSFLEKFTILDPHPNGSNFISAKSNISPSPVHECLDYHVPLTAPALLKLNGYIDPWEISYKKYRHGPQDLYDQRALGLAYQDLCIFFEEKNREKVAPRVLSIAEATFGDPENEYLDSIKTSSSSGFPYKKIYPRWKKDIFGSNSFDENSEAFGQLVTEVTKIISAWLNNVDYLIVYTENLKCERRPLHKVASGASRNFSGAPFPFSVIVKMYYFTAGEQLIRNRIKNSCTSGVNVYSPEWNELAESILGFAYQDENDESFEVLGFDGDYPAFDANQIVPIMNRCFDILDSMYPNATPEDKVVRKYIRQNIIFSKHIWKDIVFQTNGGNPSGNWLTTHINNIYNLLAFRYCYYRALPKTRDLFHHCVALQVGGDDNVGSFSPAIADKFNMQVVIKYMPEIGCKYTSADKSETDALYKNFEDLTFLKRSFRKYAGCYIGPLDIDSTLEICQWTKTDRMDIFYTNVANSLRELALHPRQLFDEKRSILKNFMQSRNLDTDSVEFQLPHSFLRDKVLKMEYYI